MPYYFSPNIGGYTNNPYMLNNSQQMQTQQYQAQQPQQQIQQTSQQPTSGLNWVQGEAGAKSFLVAPNTTVMLMDLESEVFYIKASDASGMQMMQFLASNKGKNPRDEVNKMLQSGQLSQSQFNEFWNKAQSMMGMFGGLFK